MHDPRIIAVETSSASGSVALALGPRLLAERSFSTQTQHARELLPTLALLYQECGWRAGQVEECYLSIGPGSFTGLRVAVAFARHLALATGARLCAVPTLDAIAANALDLPSPPARLAVILDAKRGQVYGAIFTHVAQPPSAVSDVAQALSLWSPAGTYQRDSEPRLIEPGVLLKEGTALSVTGEGIDYHRTVIAASGATVLDRAIWPPRAAAVYRLGWDLSRAGRFTPPRELVPCYIRKPEAEELWERRQAGGV